MPPKPEPLTRAEKAALRLLRQLVREQQRPRVEISPARQKPLPQGRA